MDNGQEKDKTANGKGVEEEGLSLPDDGHALWEWPTKYEGNAWKYIWLEAGYLAILLIIGITVLVLNYIGLLYHWYSTISCADIAASNTIFMKEMYCAIFGFLGGTVYGIKILYKAVARGNWHRDRVLWRIFTPWVSLILSLVLASIMAESIFSKNNYAAVIIGFFAGYFSESAIGKLYEIAKILFS